MRERIESPESPEGRLSLSLAIAAINLETAEALLAHRRA
jgi:hypothetical protein